MNSQELNPEEIVDEVDEPRDAPPSAPVIRFRLVRWILEKTPGLVEKPHPRLQAAVEQYRANNSVIEEEVTNG